MSPPRPRRTEAWLARAMVPGLALALFGPALPRLSQRLLGRDFVDGHGTAWFYEHVSRALRGEGRLDVSTQVYFPFGKDLDRDSGGNLLDALAAVPFRALLGPVLGTNLFWLCGLLLTGLLARAWLRSLGTAPLAATAGGLLLALGPGVLYDLAEGRPTQALLLLPLAFVAALWRCGQGPGLGPPLLAGLLLALTGLQYWFYGLFAGLAFAGHALACGLQPGREGRGPVLFRHLLVALVALVLVGPLVLPMVLGAARGELPGLLDSSGWGWKDQPLVTVEGSEVGMSTWQPLAGVSGFLMRFADGHRYLSPQVHLLPPVAALLALLGLSRPGPGRLRLLGLLLPPALLALGPTIVLYLPGRGDLALPNPFYFVLVELLPPLRRLWWPMRAMALAAIPLAALAGLGLHLLAARRRGLGQLGALLLVLDLGRSLRADLLLPVSTWDPAPPAGYRCLAQGPAGAIIDLPWGEGQLPLVWQAAHGRPLLGGLAENNPILVPQATRDLVAGNGWLFRLLQLSSRAERLPAQGPRGRTEQERATLQELGFRYVVLRRPQVEELSDAEARLDRLLGEPVWRDANLDIYAPWGDPLPCPDDPPPPDRTARTQDPMPWRDRTQAVDWPRLLHRP